MTRILAFDLSTACVGVAGAILDDDYKVIAGTSTPIIPRGFTAETLGYKKSKKKLPDKLGRLHNTYYKEGETTIKATEVKKRNTEVRNAENMYKLDYIGKQISHVIDVTKPHIILVEKNEIFNGVLTSVLLGKVMGVLIGIAASNGIKVIEYKVRTARSIMIPEILIKKFLSEEEQRNCPDVTKRALRRCMEQKYNITCRTDDEGDAWVILNYYLAYGRFE